MVHKEGDTLWYHECPHSNKKVYLPIGMKCPDCVLNEMDSLEKGKLRDETK